MQGKMKKPLRIAVTGAAGQICYSLLFRIAAGDMLGRDQPVILQLLEMTVAMKALEGVVMELDDCAFPLLAGFVVTDDMNVAFKDADYALLVGAKPRGKGMERSDLLEANSGIFKLQGRALNDYADPNAKVVVVGNPANTNAYTARYHAPDMQQENFTALTRLDHNRALALLAMQTKKGSSDIKKVIIWGNHSSTQYPDLSNATVDGEPALDLVDRSWYENNYINQVANRGAQIISARGVSSAASAANGIIGHMHDWVFGTDDDWTSMAVPSDGSYGIPKGLIYSFPVRCNAGKYQIVQDLAIDDFSHTKMQKTLQELQEEKAEVTKLWN